MTIAFDFDLPDPTPPPAAPVPATCRCHRGRGEGEGFTLDQATGQWVHVACRLPTAAYAAAMAAL